MKCPACGAEAATGASFCSKCGKPLTAVQPMTAAGIAPPTHPEEPERVLWSGTYSPKAMIGTWITCGLTTIVMLVIAILMNKREFWIGIGLGLLLLWNFQLTKLLYRRTSVRYHLTTQRLIHESGLLKRVNDRILVVQMDDIRYEQGPIERMTGVGTLRIMSADQSSPTFVIAGVENVKDVAAKLDEARREERRRRGVYMSNM